MKLLGLDSSLKAPKKKLAQELNYTGDMKKSAEMNVWLHKQVTTKLVENGGIVPDDLKAWSAFLSANSKGLLCGSRVQPLRLGHNVATHGMGKR